MIYFIVLFFIFISCYFQIFLLLGIFAVHHVLDAIIYFISQFV